MQDSNAVVEIELEECTEEMLDALKVGVMTLLSESVLTCVLVVDWISELVIEQFSPSQE